MYQDDEMFKGADGFTESLSRGDDALEKEGFVDDLLSRSDNVLPSASVYNPSPMTMNELWRCEKCYRGIRTNEDIRKGMLCPKCGSTRVTCAVPSWWETVKLFFHTGIIFLPEKRNAKR